MAEMKTGERDGEKKSEYFHSEVSFITRYPVNKSKKYSLIKKYFEIFGTL